MELNRDFSDFIACFTAHSVRYLIVGGYAVAVHGHPRYTKDLDVWVRVDDENARRIVDALEEFGFGGLGIDVDNFLAEDVVVQLGREPQRIELCRFGRRGVNRTDAARRARPEFVVPVPSDP